MKKIGEMLLAWIFTVPAAAIVGVGIVRLVQRTRGPARQSP